MLRHVNRAGSILSPSAHHFDLMFKCYEDWAAILPLKGKSDCRGRILQKMKQGHFPFGTPNYRLWHVISKELYYFIASMDVDLVWYSFEILCVGLLSSFMFQILQILSRFSSRNSNSLPSFFPQRLKTRQYFLRIQKAIPILVLKRKWSFMKKKVWRKCIKKSRSSTTCLYYISIYIQKL